MKNMKKIHRVLAAIMACIIMISVGSAMTVTASAAVVASPASDGFFSGASTLVSIIGKSNPVVDIIANGLFGAFKSFYSDATKVPQPSTQDIVNLINELNDKIDSHYNAQSSQIKALTSINKLQRFSDILTSVKGYNEDAMTQIALFKEGSTCAQDYLNIVNATNGNSDFTKDFRDLSNLIIDGQAGVKGKPSFDQYLELSKSCEENNNDSDLVKKDAQSFNDMTLEQYTLYYTNLMSGYMASYSLADLDYNNGSITKETRDSLQASIKANMELYTKKVTEVVKAYNNTKNTIDNLTVAQVTVDNKTTNMFSFGDAWAVVSKNGGTMKLMQDWKSDNLFEDTFYYKDGSAFSNGALYVKDKTVTLDMNGHSIIHTNRQNYDLKADNAALTVIDSTGKHGAISGLVVNGGKLNLNSVTVKDSSDAGLRADNVALHIMSSDFIHNENSAIVAEKNANGTITGSTFRHNNHTALYNKESDLTVSYCVFENNAGQDGGAIYNHSNMTINNCTINSNSAANGGGIFGDYNTNINNSTITGNQASSNGGGVCFGYRGSGFTEILNVTGTKLNGNSSGNEGGALWCDSMNYLNMNNVEMTNNTAVNNGGGLYASKGSASSCDPTISGKMTIINNALTNGTASNAFLGENTTSKCIFCITDNIDPSSRIGITSNTDDSTLDIVKIWNKDAYNNTANVFSYDTGAYRINRYDPWYSSFFWVEIVKN